jgi:hypothetical protein
MSNGTPPIQPAPVPPSIAGIPQPVFGSGSATVPAAGPITGSPILPPPLITNPPGTPVFPPVSPNTAPVAVPVGPLVGPAVAPAPAPPSVPGVQQPQFVPPGSGTVPTAASLFPAFSTTAPSPPIVFANVFKIGAIPPPLPSTPGQNPPPIIPSAVPTIPQLPWNPPPTTPPPVNAVRPVINILTDLNVGSTIALTTGTWTGTGPFTYARVWLRNGSPIAGQSGTSYVLTAADVGTMISGLVTARDANGLEASMNSLPVGPITEPPLESPTNNMAPIATLNPTYILCTGGNWIPANPMYTLSYQWFADGTAVEGATGSTWTFAGHEGETAYCAVTATNAAGSSVATNTNTVTIPSAVGDEDAEPSTLPAPPPAVRHGSIKPKTRKKR